MPGPGEGRAGEKLEGGLRHDGVWGGRSGVWIFVWRHGLNCIKNTWNAFDKLGLKQF